YDFSRTSASKTQATDETTVPAEPPATVVLLENYPNPFNPETTIQYTVPRSGRVRLNIYNIQGQVIRTPVDAERASGAYQIRWDGRDAKVRKSAPAFIWCGFRLGRILR
ncbi:T9SS type A sorting domain-containing protein, partial [candidate division KSB1 bacterium]|nr:T9SS type A sorting domain-containing protein [candidate division KSB1 bacterium]NIR72998.1 T9SS type A sorting domain-containing protein [candidate division KSB1 bacterium]NIS28272.1 T9SS type A sorting domain-containing protein [candidate division KSB1 bacterium]NIT75144.1 T9SS type A sorting domain-containing protein [candidate division KSB1 bacterium]NIU28951.1 T9SS type A sorting domain-containing protein [candidate division KSB1 bacterium]